MGVRGELFSTRLACDGRTYFFNVKENRMGDLFLAIVESKPTETGDFDRRSIVIFQDNAEEFVKAFGKSLKAMAEAAPSERSKERGERHAGERRDAKLPRAAGMPRDDGRDAGHRLPVDERPRHYIETGKSRRRDADARDGGTSRGAERPKTSTVKGRVLRVKPKAKAGAEAPAKPAGKRLTVKKAGPKSDDR